LSERLIIERLEIKELIIKRLEIKELIIERLEIKELIIRKFEIKKIGKKDWKARNSEELIMRKRARRECQMTWNIYNREAKNSDASGIVGIGRQSNIVTIKVHVQDKRVLQPVIQKVVIH
jgi:hypothetical protein